MWLRHHASLTLILWILDGIRAQNLTVTTGNTTGNVQTNVQTNESSSQNGFGGFQRKVFRSLRTAGSPAKLSEMDKKVVKTLKNLRDRKKKSGEPLNNKEKTLIKSLKTLQEKKGTHFRRTNELENFEDLNSLIEEIEAAEECASCEGTDQDTKPSGSHSKDSTMDSMMSRMDKMEELQSNILDRLEKLLEKADDDSGSDSDSNEPSRPWRPNYPPPGYPIYPPNYHIPAANLYASPNCPCKNGGRCSSTNLDWAICVCLGGFKGQWCEKRKPANFRRQSGNKPTFMSKTETEKQKPFKWTPPEEEATWLRRHF